MLAEFLIKCLFVQFKKIIIMLVYSKYEFCEVGKTRPLERVRFERGRFREEFDVVLKCTKRLSNFADRLIAHQMENVGKQDIFCAEADREVIQVSKFLIKISLIYQ